MNKAMELAMMHHRGALLGFFGMPGHWEVLIILFVGLLLFGHRVPGAARSLGRGIVEFRKGLKGDDDDEPRDPKRLEDDQRPRE